MADNTSKRPTSNKYASDVVSYLKQRPSSKPMLCQKRDVSPKKRMTSSGALGLRSRKNFEAGRWEEGSPNLSTGRKCTLHSSQTYRQRMCRAHVGHSLLAMLPTQNADNAQTVPHSTCTIGIINVEIIVCRTGTSCIVSMRFPDQASRESSSSRVSSQPSMSLI